MYFADTSLIDEISTVAELSARPSIPFSNGGSFITGTNRAREAYFSARGTHSGREETKSKYAFARALALRSRAKTAALYVYTRPWAPVSRGACMTNSWRRLPLSEVTGHKVMTIVALRIPYTSSIPRFFVSLSPTARASLIYSVSFVLHASLSPSPLQFHSRPQLQLLYLLGNCSDVPWLLSISLSHFISSVPFVIRFTELSFNQGVDHSGETWKKNSEFSLRLNKSDNFEKFCLKFWNVFFYLL